MPCRRRPVAGLAIWALALVMAQPASALTDHAGALVPNTATGSTSAQLASGPEVTKKLFTPDSPGDDDPLVLDALGSSATPEDDLGAALDALRDASSASDAQDARRRALDILEGNPIPDRTYSGLPLLNWDAPRKVKDVPPGGEVKVREVRYGDTVLSDAWLLRFADPDQSFTIRYEIADLGPSSAGELAPTPLLSDGGGPIGALHSVLQPLSIAPLSTGTSAVSRFTDMLGDGPGGGKEQTRQGVQQITVRMPPPRYVDAILDPDLVANGDPMSAGGNPLSALRPLTAAALQRAQDDLGFSGDAPSDAERTAAIAKLGVKAPERQLHDALDALNPDDLDAAHALGAEDRQLVTAMRSHTDLPPGFGGDPAADASVVLVNGETYRSRDKVHLAPGAALQVSVTNGDDYSRTITATQLSGSRPALGAVDWGEFDWSPVDLGPGATLAPGESRTFTVTPRDDAFELVVADPDHGELGTWALALDRGPLRQSLAFDSNATAPLHSVQDANGDVWLTLAGIDEIGRLTPTGDLASDKVERYLLPGGNHSGDPAVLGLAPHALRIDARGILWATLDAGNGIARIDPAQVRDGTEDGIRVYKLDDCIEAVCPLPFPPEPGPPPPLTRMPVQMGLEQDGQGNTVLAFAEENASAIGVMRFSPTGDVLDQTHFACGCKVPLGLDLGTDGSIWFSEAVENRIGRLTLDQAEPYKASAAILRHFDIPSGINQADPALVPGGTAFFSSVPHSLALDRHGRVWFSEEATGKVGFLDPDKAEPNTTAGMSEFTLQRNDFGRDPSPADITIDRRDTLFWADEYGDAVGSITPAGTQRLFRPADRNSLTDAPMTDSDGNLWFVEGGANLLTRISGISAGSEPPAAPPTFVARTASGTLSALGLDGTVNLQVVRAGAVVAQRSGVEARHGAFTADLGLRAGDHVQIAPQGDFAAAPFSFTVATLQGTLAADGSVAGRATLGGTALADAVDVGGRDARIDPGDGSFALSGVGAAGELAWAEGTPAGVFRTVTPYGRPDAGGPGTTPPAPRQDAPKKTATPPGKTAPRPDACRDRLWLVRTGATRRVPLLGATSTTVRRCLGKPAARVRHKTSEHWRYGTGLKLVVRGGRVTKMTILNRTFRSLPDGLTVGARTSVMRAALGTHAAASRRAKLRRAEGGYGEVNLTMRRGRVTKITIDLHRDVGSKAS